MKDEIQEPRLSYESRIGLSLTEIPTLRYCPIHPDEFQRVTARENLSIYLESDGVVRARHLLSHNIRGKLSERYCYTGNGFAELDKMVQRPIGKSFGELLNAKIRDPRGMNQTAPNVPRIVSAPNTLLRFFQPS